MSQNISFFYIFFLGELFINHQLLSVCERAYDHDKILDLQVGSKGWFAEYVTMKNVLFFLVFLDFLTFRELLEFSFHVCRLLTSEKIKKKFISLALQKKCLFMNNTKRKKGHRRMCNKKTQQFHYV